MMKEATFGAGCFWCSEPIFSQLKGVVNVKPGYSGGHIKNPSYREVCEGRTGHAEVIRIVYDSSLLHFDKLLEVFWFTHNPTTLNRQGNDVGEQYRSVIFYHDEVQKEMAEKYKAKLIDSQVYPRLVVTQIMPLINFYPAEDYHNEYYDNNPKQAYCQYVIKPKVDKFKAVFEDILK